MVLLSIVVVLLVGAVAALATGRLGGVSVAMPEAVHTTGHDVLGPDEVTRGDLATVRFDRAVRGYRMDQVDAVLDRLGEELARRDERLGELSRRLDGPSPWPATAGSAGDDLDIPQAGHARAAMRERAADGEGGPGGGPAPVEAPEAPPHGGARD